eukprot:gene28539-31698_t
MTERAENAVQSVREEYWHDIEADDQIWEKALELLIYVMECLIHVEGVHQSQLEGAVWGWMRWYMPQQPGNEMMLSGGIICDETGTGKTLKSIMILMMVLKSNEGSLKSVLVLVPTADILDQWCSEATMFFKKSPVGTHKHWMQDPSIMIATHKNFSVPKKRKGMDMA